MSEKNTTILLSRDILIESSYDVAIIKLNEFSHVPGQPVTVRYYDNQHNINSILAIGVLDGPGKDNYVIVSNGAIEPVTGVYDTRIPDVSSLVNNEVYVCYNPEDNKPSYCTIGNDNKTKVFTRITEDKTFYSALDGFFWYVTGDKIRRSDRFVDEDSLTELLQGILNSGDITVNSTKNIYTWSDNPDGIVNSGEYARVFNIPLGTSVVMAVATIGSFGNNTIDIITYSNCLGNSRVNLTTRTKDFLEGNVNGTVPVGIVRRSTSPSARFTSVYKFIVLGSTCREDEIQWFSGVGFSGSVEELTVIGSDKKFSNYVSVNYHQIGEASIDASNSNNFITITKYCKKKKLTTTFENIPGDNASYNFVVDSNISGFRVVDINQQELVDIETTVYSGSIISITKVGDNWVYNIQPPGIISKDGSVNIENTEDGLKNLTVENDNKEFVWFSDISELPTFLHNSVRQYSWIRLLDFSTPDNIETLYQQNCLTTIEIKCRALNLEGVISVGLTDTIHSFGSHIFSETLKNNFEFAVEHVSGNGFALYFRPKTENSLETTEFKVLSSPLLWSYSSEKYDQTNTNPYRIKNSYLSPITIQAEYTTNIVENTSKLVTSSALYSAVQELQNQISSIDLTSLNNRVGDIEGNYISSVGINGEVLTPTSGQVNLGKLYCPTNTRVLNSEELIGGVIAKRGSLIYTDPVSGTESILSLSSKSVFHKIVADSLSWWCLGSINEYGVIKVTVSGSKMTTITGNIYSYGTGATEASPILYTDNETLAGYIKYSRKNLYIRGSQVHPFTVEIEDFSGSSFDLIGNSVPTDVDVITLKTSTINLTDVQSLSNVGGVSEVTVESYIPKTFIVSNGTIPIIRVQKTDPSCDCFTFDVIFKDNLSKTLSVRLFLGNASNPVKTLELSNLYTYTGLIYTITYKQDELIYTIKSDLSYPLVVSDLGVSVEAISNKVTHLTENCTHDQYPSAKCVYDLKVGQRFNVSSAFDSSNGYNYQLAFKVVTPAVVDVYWVTNSGTHADTLYINGKPGKASTYNIRCHNELGVFSIKYIGGDFYVCIPAKRSSTSSTITYHFSAPIPMESNSTGTCTELTTVSFTSSAIPATFVGQNLELTGDSIYNLSSTSVTNLDFSEYDTVIALAPGNNIIVKGTDLPNEDKIYHIVNSTGENISNLFIEGKNSNNNTINVNINNVQAGADVTLAWVAESNMFTYDISLQEIYSPDKTIKAEKSKNQWKIDVAPSVLDSIASKQPRLVYDPAPIKNSTNAISSGAVYDALLGMTIPSTLVLTSADIGVRLYPVNDCNFIPDIVMTTNYTFDSDEYVLILDKEYSTIVAEYPPTPGDSTAGPNFGLGSTSALSITSGGTTIYPIIRFIVPCGIIQSIRVGASSRPPGVVNGITQFNNGYSFKSMGLSLSRKDLYSHKYLIGHCNYYGLNTFRYRYLEYVHWDGYWYNPYGY